MKDNSRATFKESHENKLELSNDTLHKEKRKIVQSSIFYTKHNRSWQKQSLADVVQSCDNFGLRILFVSWSDDESMHC